MIREQLFIEATELDGSLEIVNEVIGYAESQHKHGTLRPEFYDDVLLLAAEVLHYVDNQDGWIDLGYQLCKSLKQDMERYGYRNQTAMFGGLGQRSFAVRGFCEQANVLQGFSRSMDHLLFIAVDNKVEQAQNHPTFDANYDVVSGISGTLYYLLDCDYTREERNILLKCIEYLVSLTQDTEFGGRAIIGFHILQPNQSRGFDQKDFKDGSINFGLAHGMLGPLIALAKAYAKGFAVDGLKEGIEKLYHLYETYQSANEVNVPYWPRTITVEEYWERACKPAHLHRPCSWCYGNIGILRGLQKVAGYMNWPEREREYIEAMKRFLAQDSKEYGLFSPSLCHGFSSVVAIQNCAYSAYGDPKLLTNLERNVWELVTEYRKHNEKEVSLMDIRDETIWVEGYLKDLSFLTGSIGVAATLLSLRGTMKTGKLLMID